MAVDEDKLARNPAKLVRIPKAGTRRRDTWTTDEVRAFLRLASKDRLEAAWRLSLYGLRRGEVLGLRWSDIDLETGTLLVNQARVLVEYKVLIEEPKSENGKRTLPIDVELIEAMKRLRKRQAHEAAEAGTTYGSRLTELDWYTRATPTW